MAKIDHFMDYLMHDTQTQVISMMTKLGTLKGFSRSAYPKSHCFAHIYM